MSTLFVLIRNPTVIPDTLPLLLLIVVPIVWKPTCECVSVGVVPSCACDLFVVGVR